ncbi:MAG: hypothetical protein GYA36_19415 [Veillonellaceae bacterium]|nr:hypothetical protein [Veillonellaceae bacterium]
MGNVVKWAQMKDSKYSGPMVRGICTYSIPDNPTGFDVIVAATARPEGGAYDTVVMYDGTAVTYGLLQWTFTSGRLHKLLLATARAMGESQYCVRFGWDLFNLAGLAVGSNSGSVQTDLNDETLYYKFKKVANFFKLRDVCTPPGGAVPRTGKNWEKAKAIALLFSKLGEIGIAQKAQIDFFREELKHEINLKRPKMEGRTIASYLYPMGWEEGDPVHFPWMIALRALFFGVWQNSPRKAEEYLHLVFRDFKSPLNSQEAVDKLAKKIAYSNYARWGVEKAKQAERPYTSRYQKVAEEINKVMQQVIVPEYWK